MKTFEFNGKTYPQVEITFNVMCDLEEAGVSITDIQSKSMSFMRAYLAICMKKSPEEAGREMEQHLINGGDFESIGNAIADAFQESGFFQALQKDEKKNTSKNPKA